MQLQTVEADVLSCLTLDCILRIALYRDMWLELAMLLGVSQL